MIKKLKFAFGANRLIADRLEILERKIRDLELWVYGTDAIFNADGRLVSASGTTITYGSDGNWSTLTDSSGTIHYSWVEDQFGNPKVSVYS